MNGRGQTDRQSVGRGSDVGVIVTCADGRMDGVVNTPLRSVLSRLRAAALARSLVDADSDNNLSFNSLQPQVGVREVGHRKSGDPAALCHGTDDLHSVCDSVCPPPCISLLSSPSPLFLPPRLLAACDPPQVPKHARCWRNLRRLYFVAVLCGLAIDGWSCAFVV